MAEAEKRTTTTWPTSFFFPSAMEGFGLTVAEAMSSGLPVVASNRGSIPEVVADGESGFVVRPGGPETFVAQAGAPPLAIPRCAPSFGAANRERVERIFRWERCVEARARVYEATVEAWRRHRAAARR